MKSCQCNEVMYIALGFEYELFNCTLQKCGVMKRKMIGNVQIAASVSKKHNCTLHHVPARYFDESASPRLAMRRASQVSGSLTLHPTRLASWPSLSASTPVLHSVSSLYRVALSTLKFLIALSNNNF